MRKIMFLLIVITILSSVVLLLMKQYEDEDSVEKVYTIKSSYAYLSKDETVIDVKIYTNKKSLFLQIKNLHQTKSIHS